MQVNKVLGIYTGCFSQVITYLKSSASSYHQNSLKLPPNLTLWEFLRTSYICLSVTMLLKMCLTVTLKFIYNTKIKKKTHHTTHRSNKVYVVKDLRCNFFPSIFSTKCAFGRPLVNMYPLQLYYFTK